LRLFGNIATTFLKGNTMKLLSVSTDAKTTKGESLGFLTGILYLAPATTTKWNTCPMAKIAQCDKACLYTAGRGAMNSVQKARIRKTEWFFEDRQSFMQQLVVDIDKLFFKAKRMGLTPLVRLNGTSDIRWESIPINGYKNIFEAFPDVQFYDYTKDANRRDLPANYDLTFSYSGVEGFQPFVAKALKKQMRIAVVFRKEQDIPTTFMGIPVVSGDNSDVRHLDDKVIVGLYAKGKAKLDTTGFVV
jgi:Gene product 88